MIKKKRIGKKRGSYKKPENTYAAKVRAMQVGDEIVINTTREKRLTYYVGAKIAVPDAKFSMTVNRCAGVYVLKRLE